MTIKQMQTQYAEELYIKCHDILTNRPETLTLEEFHEHIGAMQILAQLLDISNTSHACIHEMEFREVRKEARKRRAKCTTTT